MVIQASYSVLLRGAYEDEVRSTVRSRLWAFCFVNLKQYLLGICEEKSSLVLPEVWYFFVNCGQRLEVLEVLVFESKRKTKTASNRGM